MKTSSTETRPTAEVDHTPRSNGSSSRRSFIKSGALRSVAAGLPQRGIAPIGLKSLNGTVFLR